MATAYTPPGDPTDVVGRRFAAFLIDAVLLGSLGFFVFAVLRSQSYAKVPADACKVLRKAGGNPLCLKLGSHVFLWHSNALRITVLVVLLAALLDGVVLQSMTGATVGKLCMRLSVVDEHGQIAKPLRMVGRWVFLVVDLGFCLVGCISIVATHPHRRLGDFVFGTYVISLRSVGRPIGGEMALTASAKGAPSTNGSPENWTAPPAPCAREDALGRAAPDHAAAGADTARDRADRARRMGRGGAAGAAGSFAAMGNAAGVGDRRVSDLVRPDRRPEVGRASGAAGSRGLGVRGFGAGGSAAEEAASESEPVEAVLGDTETEPETEPDAEAEPDSKPEAAEEAEAAPALETKEPAPDEGASDDDASEPELSEWSPVVTSAKRRRSRPASDDTASGGDESWWDEALSSGDVEDAPDGAS